MKTFFLITRIRGDRGREDIACLEEMITEMGGRASHFYYPEVDPDPIRLPIPEDTDCILALGGDGTMVRAAQAVVGAGLHIPLIGINRGHLGYLCELDMKSVSGAVGRLFRDDYEIEERMMLSGKLLGEKGKEKEEIHALNDVVITAGNGLNLIKVSVYINGSYLYSYNGDGVILSTPTGSTAYNLSANGPIVDPKTQVILLTPLNPHTLNTRAIVLDPKDELEVELNQRHQDLTETATVAFDGFHRVRLDPGDRVRIRRSPDVIRLIRLSRMNFLERISKKMQEN